MSVPSQNTMRRRGSREGRRICVAYANVVQLLGLRLHELDRGKRLGHDNDGLRTYLAVRRVRRKRLDLQSFYYIQTDDKRLRATRRPAASPYLVPSYIAPSYFAPSCLAPSTSPPRY